MKKALGQTVRDLKREVNKKVLKVPGIEQKVLDSTSNEPWGPHGSLLADIAQATKNYHEYQMIMAVIWKRINDTGKNWRHVYKALTVLEYLVANGSERVIDEIREHAYQISTLSDFQYIDSGGRDQGSNVRKKSQSLVLLVNDKERIQEVRQKAAANRDKFRNTSSTGGMYRPDRPDDDRYEGRYGSRDEDRNGYGRERDDDRYGRYGDSYGRDGDRYGRDSEERYGRDGYRDDDYRGRSRSIDEYQYGSRSRSSDRDRAYDEDGNYSSRGSGARADENSVEGRGLERKFSEQSIGAPPSYEEAVGDARSPVHNDRDGETSAPSAPKPSSPPVSTSPSQATTGLGTSASPVNQEFDSFDEFDPRGGSVPAAPAAPATSNTPETDLLGALSDALAIVPTTSEADVPANSDSTFGASSFGNQSFEDPFGDSPFKAIPSTDNVPAQSQSFPPTSFQGTTNQTFEPQPPVTTTNTETASNFDFGDTFPGITYSSSSDPNTDILAGILPPSGSSAPITSQSSFPEPAQQPNANVVSGFGSTPPVSSYMPPQPYNGGPFQTQSGLTPLMAPPQHNNGLYGSQFGSAGPAPSQSQFGSVGPVPSQSQFGSVGQVPSQSQFGSVGPVPSQSQFGSVGPVPSQSQFGSAGPVPSQFGSAGPVPSQFGSAGSVPSQMARPAQQHNSDGLGNLMGPATSPASSVGPLAIVPVQPTKEKFETKSTVWADTLSRGLVDLNISGVKTNPLADIGIDFDAINRKEKRMEKPTTAPVVSTINMGKAMGSGSGMGRAGANAIRPPANPMMAPGMGMGTGMGMGAGYGSMSQPMGGMGMGMGLGAGYGGMSQPMGGMGMNMGGMGGMGMGMNMGMGQGHPMQPPTGMPPGPPTMQGGYNPMMGGGGGYAPQQPYGGGYR